MIIKVFYTQDYFSYYDNDYNNTFTVPNTNNPITWREITNPRVKWLDNDRAEMVINNQVSGQFISASPNFRAVSRIKITKQRSESSASTYGNYIYFVKEVKRQLDGGCIVELELDYWLTYFDLSPFGNVGSFLLGAPDQLIIDRSHLMPEPSSWLANTASNYTYISDWPQYNALVSTLERLPFDISKSVDKILYHNQNFLMCAPNFESSCGLVDIAYPDTYYSMESSQTSSIKLSWAMPFKNNATHDYHLSIYLVYNNIASNLTLEVPTSTITQLAKELKDNFNKSNLFLVIPYNVEAGIRVSNNSRVEFYALTRSTFNYPRFLLVPAPVGSKAYQLYITGKLSSIGVFLIDMPLPNVLGLINNNWNKPPYAIYDSDNKLGVGLAAIKDFQIDDIVYKQYLLGFKIENPDFVFNANYLKEGITDDRDLNFKMIDDRYNRKPTFCSWGEFLNGYTANQSTNDLYILKGLNNIYFNFKSGFIQYNFQDYELHNDGLSNLEFKINIFGWSFALQTQGFIKLNDTNTYTGTFYNNATSPWFYSNATRTSNYSQWISPLIFNNGYYEFMNSQNNSFNTSLKQMRWNHLTNLIAPTFSTAVGAGGAAYSGLTGAFGKLGVLGGVGMAISGTLNLGKTLVNNYFDVEKKNSFLADLNATHNGFTNATGNYNIDVLPSMLQVVINDYMKCRIWNWINKYGYTVIDTFNARHINLNNLKTNKVVLNGVIEDNQKSNSVMKYGCIRFLNDNLAIINKAMRGSQVAKLFEVLPTNAINWMSGLMTHGISFCCFFTS